MSGTASPSTSLLPAGFLSTSGNQIVSAGGVPVRIQSINWFGLETTALAPGGLDMRSYQSMMNQMVQLGFNTIRLPFSLQSLGTSSVPAGWAVNTTLNPDLAGKTSLQVMDAIVAYAGKIGLKIVLDDHRSAAGNGPNDNGLWYDGGYTDAQWTADWKMLAQHYAGNATVIGADLSNEPHGAASWGDGRLATDWQAAATRAGDAIQSVNPGWLMFVEGVQNAGGVSTMWGENLTGVAAHPVTLTDPDKVVYSPHDYPSSVSQEPYFTASNYPNNLASVWTQDWGYISQQNIAPVFLGEFGSTLQSTSDQQWLAQLVTYLDSGLGGTSKAGTSWSYWDWNPNSGDTGGILNADWTTVDATKLAAIGPLFTQSTASTTSSSTPSSSTPSSSTPSSSNTSSSSTGVPAPISLGNGNFSIAPTGFGCVITGGDGAITIGQGASAPLGNATIRLGNGRDCVTAFGQHDVITCGNGNDLVVGPQGNATITLGRGNNTVVAFGTGNTVSVGDTAAPSDPAQLGFVNAAGGGATVSTGNGTFYILTSGTGDVVTTASASRAFIFGNAADPASGGASIRTGDGADWIALAGKGNTVDAGGGLNVIYGSGGSDLFAMHSSGIDFIHGAGLQSGDRLDLSTLLSGTNAGADLTKIGRFVQVATHGGDAWVSVDATGGGNFAGNPVAILFGDGGDTLQQMQQAGMFRFA